MLLIPTWDIHFHDVVGIDYVLYQVSAQSNSIVHRRGFDTGSLLGIGYLDRDGQATCTAVLTSILAAVCNQLRSVCNSDLILIPPGCTPGQWMCP